MKMKMISKWLVMGWLLLLLGACNSSGGDVASDVATTAVAESATVATPAGGMGMMGRGMGMGQGMGMGGGGMMARHHATIPQEYAGLANPVPADEASLERGGEIYTTHCATCHGDGGMGDGPAGAALDPVPAPIAHTSQMLGDDYLFWRISEGGHMEPFNSGMIAWEAILDEDARWDVINYVRALGSGTVMPRQQMGGAAFDPAIQAEQQAQMLAEAVALGVITEDEGAVFTAVHEHVDTQMHQMRSEGASAGMDDLMAEILAALVADGTVTQSDADTFLSVHDRLGEAGLMQ